MDRTNAVDVHTINDALQGRTKTRLRGMIDTIHVRGSDIDIPYRHGAEANTVLKTVKVPW